MSKIKIATDFNVAPGARYYTDGPNSGQEFFEKILSDAFEKALQKNEILTVDLDGTRGYAPSFLSEAFGLLSEKFGPDVVLKHLEIISEQIPRWRSRILDDYIPNATLRKKKEQTENA